MKLPKKGLMMTEGVELKVKLIFPKRKKRYSRSRLVGYKCVSFSEGKEEFYLRKNRKDFQVTEIEYKHETDKENLKRIRNEIIEKFFQEHPKLDDRTVRVEFT